MNNLQLLLDMQRSLQEDHGQYQFKDQDPNARAAFLRTNVLGCTAELHEALDETGWKPWATSRHVNREAYLKELIDALHFYLNLCLIVDTDAEELMALYQLSYQKNVRRWTEGYDGVSSKCPKCKRELIGRPAMCAEHGEPERTDGVQG